MSKTIASIASILAADNAPVIVVDQDGQVTEVNRLFEISFKWQSEDLVGRPVSAIIPVALHDAHHMGFSRFLLTGQGGILEQELDLEIVLGDGSVISASHYIMTEKTGRGRRFAAIIKKNS